MTDSTKHFIADLICRYPKLEVCESSIENAVQILINSYNAGGKLLVCGNGGSAADSLHIVGELMKSFILPRKLSPQTQAKLRSECPDIAQYCIDNLQCALPAISLVSETGLSTAYANDNAPDLAFAQQVIGHGKQEDVLLAISTSGNSKNVLYAAGAAKAIGVKVLGLTGMGGGELAAKCDDCICVPETETFKIQELHLPVYHTICISVENEFFG
ncbi:MAG: SIS domain-containing protein [Oscillospiraceae bacterium]